MLINGELYQVQPLHVQIGFKLVVVLLANPALLVSMLNLLRRPIQRRLAGLHGNLGLEQELPVRGGKPLDHPERDAQLDIGIYRQRLLPLSIPATGTNVDFMVQEKNNQYYQRNSLIKFVRLHV